MQSGNVLRLDNLVLLQTIKLGTLRRAPVTRITVETHLHNPIEVEAHGQLGNVAHEVVQPVVQASQHGDWFLHVPRWAWFEGKERMKTGFDDN